MDVSATLRPGAGPIDAIDPSAWASEVRDAYLDKRWASSVADGYCVLQRTTADGVVVKLESIGRQRQSLLVTAHAFDGISYGVALHARSST